MMVDKWIKTIVALLALLFALLMGSPSVRAENQWEFGTDISFLADTTDDTMFSSISRKTIFWAHNSLLAHNS